MKTVYYFLCRRAHISLLQSALTVLMILSGALLAGDLQGQDPGCVFACPPMEPPTVISLSAECEDEVSPELVGLVPQDCLGPYVVEIFDDAGNSYGNTIDYSMLNQTFMVIISSENPEDDGQNCMTAITVVDKMDPIVSCPDDVTVPCPTPLEDIPPLTEEDVEDCSPVEIDWVDVPVFNNMCDGDIVSKFQRTYYIIDNQDNVYTCTQMISLEKVPVDDVEGPPDLKGDDALPCFPEPDLSPENTGYPTVNGDPVMTGNVCNLMTSYSDVPVPICSGGYKIVRTWIIMDWCENSMSETTQIIEVKDFTGPEVDVPDYLFEPAGTRLPRGCIIATGGYY